MTEGNVLDLMKDLLDQVEREDRTGTGTRSSFGHRFEFDLSDGSVPILTTKKVYYKSVLEELLFFIRGETDSKKLKTKIWRANSSKEALEKLGLEYEEGELGPVYGFQWRYFGADYDRILALTEELNVLPKEELYQPSRTYLESLIDLEKKKGFDQLAWVINEIKTKPSSRRLVVSAWNPKDIGKMVLPPCHVMFQFYVNGDQLDVQVYQRSADVFLGLPFNLASYGTLLHMVAKETNYKPGRMIYVLGDAHIYLNHVDQVKEQITRIPFDFPKIEIGDKPFFELEMDGVLLVGYEHHPPIEAEMST